LVAPLCLHAFTPWPLLHYHPSRAGTPPPPLPGGTAHPQQRGVLLVSQTLPARVRSLCHAPCWPHLPWLCSQERTMGDKAHHMAAMDTLGETRYFSSCSPSSLVSVEIMGLMA
jgi:hypothetical protein